MNESDNISIVNCVRTYHFLTIKEFIDNSKLEIKDVSKEITNYLSKKNK